MWVDILGALGRFRFFQSYALWWIFTLVAQFVVGIIKFLNFINALHFGTHVCFLCRISNHSINMYVGWEGWLCTRSCTWLVPFWTILFLARWGQIFLEIEYIFGLKKSNTHRTSRKCQLCVLCYSGTTPVVLGEALKPVNSSILIFMSKVTIF